MAVMDAPIVKIGRQQTINSKFNIIKSHSLVKKRVTGLSGEKKFIICSFCKNIVVIKV